MHVLLLGPDVRPRISMNVLLASPISQDPQKMEEDLYRVVLMSSRYTYGG